MTLNPFIHWCQPWSSDSSNVQGVLLGEPIFISILTTNTHIHMHFISQEFGNIDMNIPLTMKWPCMCACLSADMSDEDSISAAVQAVSKQIGASGLNLLINNAAINKPAVPALLDVTGKKDMMEVYETNVVGPFLLVKVGLSYTSLCCLRVHTHRCRYTDRNR